MSLVGAGGIGKTTVALAVAEQQAGLHEHGAFFVDLSALSDAAQVVAAVGQSCGLDVARGEPWAILEAGLCGQQALIVLDNCEHVIDAAAAMAARLLRACPRLRILATSREALEIDAEWVFKLPPLAVPGPEDALGLDAVLAYPAIQLFVERARAACDTFQLTEANVSAVRQLCEFLDGMPLVLELAAARVNSLGAQGLLLRLESAFELLTRGRRVAMSRHQTLHAVLNWSYELLTDSERQVLQRLAVFSGMFDLEGAVAVATSPDLPADGVTEGVLSLCAKSLVTTVPAGDGRVAHRLLHITRLFANRALASTPDAWAARRRHALYLHGRMVEANRQPTALRHYRDSLARSTVIAELRSAIHWALLEENDLVLGMEIVAESVALYITTGFVDECSRFLMAAIDRLAKAGAVGTRLEYLLQERLHKIHGQALVHSETKARVAARVRELAAQFCSPLERIEALYSVCGSAYGEGRYLQALAVCDEIRELAQGEHAPLSITVGDRLAALNLHALGQHDAAERLARRVMHVDTSTQPWGLQSAVPAAVAMRIQLARIHWLRGDFRQAWETVHAAIATDPSAHLYARCQPLGMAAIPMAIWQGDLPTAERWTQELLAHSTQAGMLYWQAFAKVYACVIEGRPVPPGSPEAELLHKSMPLMDIQATLQLEAPNLTTVARVRDGEVGWCAPEVLRRAALSVLHSQVVSDNTRDSCMAELRRAFDLSVEQGARFWSLRIAISMCEVASAGSAMHSWAQCQLLALVGAIDDGSAQPDLLRARRLLAGGTRL